jgi:hypothetical protein
MSPTHDETGRAADQSVIRDNRLRGENAAVARPCTTAVPAQARPRVGRTAGT